MSTHTPFHYPSHDGTVFDARTVARALGGTVIGSRQVSAPAPGHSSIDRSLSIRLDPRAPDGFFVHCFSDPTRWAAARDHVKDRLGFSTQGRRFSVMPRSTPPRLDDDIPARIERAMKVWNASTPISGTLAEKYLVSRGLDTTGLEHVVRFNARTPWRSDDGELQLVSCMVSIMRSVTTDEPRGIHRTRLTVEGQKIDRRMLGTSAGTAMKIDHDDTVTGGLHVGEGLETVLAARQMELRPAWALGSSGAVRSFPVLNGVECLSLFRENDPISHRDVESCAARWHAAGRHVRVITPTMGSDMNDALRGAA